MSTIHPERDFDVLREIAVKGSRHAAESLGLFSGDQLTVGEADACILPFEEFVTVHGDPEEIVAGVNFLISGDIEGYILAFFRERDVVVLLQSLIGQPPLSVCELDDLELSAIGESGNIIVSSFLSSLEHLCGLSAMPSPPAVAVEMCGAILSSAVLPLVEEGGEVLMIEAEIRSSSSVDASTAACRILFLPSVASWVILRKAFWEQQESLAN